jgi:N-methylhydantoinase A
MEAEAGAAIAAEAPPETPVVVERFLDMRYVGQEYTVKVPVANARLTPDDLAALRAEFDRLHEQAYGHASAAEPTEIINARLTAYGTLRYPELPQIASGPPEPSDEARLGEMETWFEESGVVACPVYDRAHLLAGNRIEGPALILESGATTVLHPGFTCTVDPFGNLVLRPTEQA